MGEAGLDCEDPDRQQTGLKRFLDAIRPGHCAQSVRFSRKTLMNMKKLITIVAAALIAAISLTSCETSGQDALLGAATGAAVGGAVTGRGSCAFHGAAIGAAGGYLIGKLVRADQRRHARERYGDEYDDRYDDRNYYHDYDRGGDRYPVARPTSRQGFVTSPFKPYNRIDVRGIPRGAKVEDPSAGRIFINP